MNSSVALSINKIEPVSKVKYSLDLSCTSVDLKIRLADSPLSTVAQ